MTDDLAAVRARHQRDARPFWYTLDDGSRDEFHYCGCARRWPCEVVEVLAAYDTLVRLAHRDCDRCAADDCDACTDTTDGQRPCYCPHRFAAQEKRLAAVDVWVSMHAEVDHHCGECRVLREQYHA